MVQQANIKTKWENSGNIATSHIIKEIFPQLKKSIFNTPATFTKQPVNFLRNNVLKSEMLKKTLHTKKKIKRKGVEII